MIWVRPLCTFNVHLHPTALAAGCVERFSCGDLSCVAMPACYDGRPVSSASFISSQAAQVLALSLAFVLTFAGYVQHSQMVRGHPPQGRPPVMTPASARSSDLFTGKCVHGTNRPSENLQPRVFCRSIALQKF